MLSPAALSTLKELRAVVAGCEHHAQRGPREFRRIMRQFEPRLNRAFLRAVGAAINGTVQSKIVEALQAGNVDDAIAAVPWDTAAQPILESEFLGTFRQVYEASGVAAAAGITAKLKGAGRLRFSLIDDRPIQFLRSHGAELVSEFGLQNREGLRAALFKINEDGTPAVQAARQIKQHIGLSEPFSRAVANRRSALIADGVPVADIERQVARYSRELLDLRALNIARTEAQRAYGSAHIEALGQAADNDLIDRDKATKTWSTANDDVVRDSHADLEGVTVAWDEQFEVDGELVDGPPAGVNCRCTMDINPLG